jgi:hypothetical protein
MEQNETFWFLAYTDVNLLDQVINVMKETRETTLHVDLEYMQKKKKLSRLYVRVSSSECKTN